MVTPNLNPSPPHQPPGCWNLDPNPQLITASSQLLLRLGFAFNIGYRAQLVPRDDPRYAWVKFGRWGLLETSKADTFPRPDKLIEIYEFEACPYCRQVTLVQPRDSWLVGPFPVFVAPRSRWVRGCDRRAQRCAEQAPFSRLHSPHPVHHTPVPSPTGK